MSGKFVAGSIRVRGKPRPDQLVALCDRYEQDLETMQALYKQADEVHEVSVMKVRETFFWLLASGHRPIPSHVVMWVEEPWDEGGRSE